MLALILPSCRAIEQGQAEQATGVLPQPRVHAGDLGEPGVRKTDFQLPASPMICGARIPIDRPAVRERLEFEFLLLVHNPAQVELWRRRALRYFPLIESSLRNVGLPDDLKYLAVGESDLRPLAVSPAGAAGLWQFMPSTARGFGVKVSRAEDQRLLADVALPAGLEFLRELNGRFGDWPLAMAAYNAGGGRVSQALSGQGASDYWELNLPKETERYVYRIAAIKLVMEGAPAYGFNDRAPSGLYAPRNFDQETLTFPKGTTWASLAARYGCPYKELKLLNPHLASRSVLEGGPYVFRTPKKSV
ncbi:MAG: lytic transglycosylase domain-containing protein [Deltaproteobacteria bacterium]|nr:lytic transglycosylase domain-containing protein [Deltaproteobacteria bacterium]